MVNYPIRVSRHPYGGRDERKMRIAREWNRDAQILEDCANEMIRKKGCGVYHYSAIAIATRIDVDRVRKIMFCVDCGSNGFTVSRDADGNEVEFLKER